MSGPTAMALGAYAFEAVGFGFNGLSRKVQTPWAEIKVAQSLDQQQWLGPTAEEVVIKGVLFPAEFGGQASLDGIIAAAMSGTPLPLVSGDMAGGLTHGIFTVQSVDEDQSHHTAFGAPRRNAYSITLKRYNDLGGATMLGGSILQTIINIFG